MSYMHRLVWHFGFLTWKANHTSAGEIKISTATTTSARYGACLGVQAAICLRKLRRLHGSEFLQKDLRMVQKQVLVEEDLQPKKVSVRRST